MAAAIAAAFWACAADSTAVTAANTAPFAISLECSTVGIDGGDRDGEQLERVVSGTSFFRLALIFHESRLTRRFF